MSTVRLVAGCMTGTSLDGLDVAVVEIHGRGLEMRARLVASQAQPLGEVGASLRRIARQDDVTARDIAGAALAFGQLHARVVGAAAGGRSLSLIAVHGQTVFHAPPLSWQLVNPWPLVRSLRTPVLFDLRGADLAAGGQGAPITPLADWVLFRDAHASRAVVNLGGFCNVTVLPPGGPELVRGFDVCACNQLLDSLARSALKAPYDEGGRFALSGRTDPEMVSTLVGWLKEQAAAGRSLGTGDEEAPFLKHWRNIGSAEDLAASACEAIAVTIAERLPVDCRVVLAGGGTNNLALRRALEARLGHECLTTEALGVPISLREAVCMAVLGALCQDGVPITLPAVTGVPAAPIAGCWAYPESPRPA